MILDLDLAVALEGHIGHAALAASPLGRDTHLLQINLLGIVIAGKDIVQTQRAPVKTVIELLRHRSDCSNSD